MGMSSVCGSRNSRPKVIYAWALNATGLQLPSDVGIKIGPSAQISSIAVQIHYGHPESKSLRIARPSFILFTDCFSSRCVLQYSTKEMLLAASSKNLKNFTRVSYNYVHACLCVCIIVHCDDVMVFSLVIGSCS